MDVLDLLLILLDLPNLVVDFILDFWPVILVSLFLVLLIHFCKTTLPDGWRDIF